jgi:tetratricopeptide (TPR) repeat protein
MRIEMDDIHKWAFGFLKRNWMSFSGLIFVIVLLIMTCFKLGIPYKLYVISGLAFIWILFWFIKSGRLIFPTNKYLIIFCIKTDQKSVDEYKKLFFKLQNELDALNLTKSVKLKDISSDIINNTKQAERYRESQNINLIIWGSSFSETQNGKSIVNFHLKYTFRINKRLNEKLKLFALDLALIVGTKEWTINTDNTLFEEVRVVNNFIEACIFIAGIHFLTDYKLVEAIKLFNALKSKLINVEDDNFKKFVQGRINALIVETYFLLGMIETEKENYELAKKYLAELIKYPVNKFRAYIQLANLEYLLGNLDMAKQYSEKASDIDKNHPAIYVNTAFFRILEKRYDKALYWYKRIADVKAINVDIPKLLEFLNDRYNENKKELAFLFAVGIINYFFYDHKNGLSDLSNFIRRVRNKQQYFSMKEYAKELKEKDKHKKATEAQVKRINQ